MRTEPMSDDDMVMLRLACDQAKEHNELTKRQFDRDGRIYDSRQKAWIIREPGDA